MNFFDTRPNLFRVLFGVLALAIAMVFAVPFYETGTSPTDENLFRNPPSALYVARDGKNQPSVRVGDMITEVGNKRVFGLDDFQEELRNKQGDQVHVAVLRLSEDKTHRFTVSIENLRSSIRPDLPKTVYVFEVSDGGASDRAGMKVGDLILRINGQSFKDMFDADRLLREGETGKASNYDVLRNNEVIRLHVTLAPFGIPVHSLLLAISCVVFMGFGTFLGLKRAHLPAGRLLGMFFLVASPFIGLALLRRGPGSILNIVVMLSLCLAVALWFHSTHYFPRERSDLLSKRWPRIGMYILAVAAVILPFIMSNLGLIIALAAMILYINVVRFKFRKTVTQEYKQLARPIVWTGRTVGALCLAMGLSIAFIVGQTGKAQSIVGLMGLTWILIPASYFYSIGRYHLLDLDLRIRRSARYNILAGALRVGVLVGGGYVLYLLASWEPSLPNIQISTSYVELLDTQATSERLDFLQNLLITTMAIAAGFVFVWSGKKGLTVLARRFHRTQYDYREASNQLAGIMATRLSMTSLAQGIVEKLADLMHLKQVGVLFFRNENICCCQEAHGFDGREWKEFCIESEDSVMHALKETKAETRVEYLPSTLKHAFQSQGFQLLIPIWSKDRLIGAIVVGEKMSEAPFDREDMEFLRSAARQASVSIENAFLYEELTEQERMKHELAIARRIQMESLPQTTPRIEGLDISGMSVPALEVGGDYYDFLNGTVGTLTVVVGDVSGKGTSAALYMSKVQGILRSLHGFVQSPRDLFVRTNQLLSGDLERKSFVTAIAGSFNVEQRTLTLARAGHLPLYQYDADQKRVEGFVPSGMGLALSSDSVFSSNIEESVIPFAFGDIFLFISDGITEAQSSDRSEFGEERVREVLLASSQETACVVRDRLLSALKDFSGAAPQHDDQTLVVVKIVA